MRPMKSGTSTGHLTVRQPKRRLRASPHVSRGLPPDDRRLRTSQDTHLVALLEWYFMLQGVRSRSTVQDATRLYEAMEA
jgi:hypothetical protein